MRIVATLLYEGKNTELDQTKKPEVAQKMALLLDEFRHSDMTKEEFINHKDRLNFEGTFQDVIFKFREDTGLMLVRATEHEFEEKGAF